MNKNEIHLINPKKITQNINRISQNIKRTKNHKLIRPKELMRENMKLDREIHKKIYSYYKGKITKEELIKAKELFKEKYVECMTKDLELAMERMNEGEYIEYCEKRKDWLEHINEIIDEVLQDNVKLILV